MSWSVFCLCICMCVTIFAKQGPFFRNDYTYSEASKTFYKEHREMLKWRDAVIACSLEGAALAVPASENEMNVLLALMRKDTANVWLGLHDLYTEMHYMTFEGRPARDLFMNRQKNHQGGLNRDCVKMSRTGVYQDMNCDGADRFICKALPSALAYNAECEIYDKEYKKYPSMGDYCHKLHTKPKNWHDAFKTCAAEQAQLVVINSAEEAKLCTDLFNRQPAKGPVSKDYMYIGFHDLIIQGQYMTIDGKTLETAGFSSWAPGQPDNNQNEHCGTLTTRTHLLNDITCTHELFFVCEKKIHNEICS